jgi:hypothetical protein
MHIKRTLTGWTKLLSLTPLAALAGCGAEWMLASVMGPILIGWLPILWPPLPAEEHSIHGGNAQRVLMGRSKSFHSWYPYAPLEKSSVNATTIIYPSVRRFDIVAVDLETLESRFIRTVTSSLYDSGWPRSDGEWLVWREPNDPSVHALHIDNEVESRFFEDWPENASLVPGVIGGGKLLLTAGPPGYGAEEVVILLDLTTGEQRWFDVYELGYIPRFTVLSDEWLVLYGNPLFNAAADPPEAIGDGPVLDLVNLKSGERRRIGTDIYSVDLYNAAPRLTDRHLLWIERSPDTWDSVIRAYDLAAGEVSTVKTYPYDTGNWNEDRYVEGLGPNGALVFRTQYPEPPSNPMELLEFWRAFEVREFEDYELFDGRVIPLTEVMFSFFPYSQCWVGPAFIDRFLILRDPTVCDYIILDTEALTTRRLVDPFADLAADLP